MYLRITSNLLQLLIQSNNIIISILIANGQSIQVIEKRNTYPCVNSTVLYPVDKNVFSKANMETKENEIRYKNPNADATIWKINTTFSSPNDKSEEEDTKKLVGGPTKIGDKDRDNEKYFKPNLFIFPKDKSNETDFDKAITIQDISKENATDSKDKNTILKQSEEKKEFKPSPHLNSYYDTLDDSPLQSFTSYAQPEKIPTSTYFEFPRVQYTPTDKPPKEYVAFPYKYEQNVFSHTNAAWGSHGLQSRPTDEAPVKIPAGGLYYRPDVLKEIPNSFGDDNFSLDGHDSNNFKDGSLKKRSNPWKSFLHLATALLPVGLLVSALTPSVISIQNLEPEPQHFKRVSRRSDPLTMPAVSEQCKRRLLCEIHSDRNYQSNTTPYHRPKQCYKIQCDDPQAVSRMLHWLLTYHRSGDSRGRGYT